MIEIKVSGNTAEEVVGKLSDLLASMGGHAAPANADKKTTAKPATTLPPPAKEEKPKLTEENVRAAWAAKKEAGHAPSDLTEVLSTLGVKKISELTEAQYPGAIKLLNALSK